MKILISIPKDILEKYQIEADKIHRSRKNLMEKVLMDYLEAPIETILNTPQFKKTTKEVTKNLIETNSAGVEIKKTNNSIETRPLSWAETEFLRLQEEQKNKKNGK